MQVGPISSTKYSPVNNNGSGNNAFLINKSEYHSDTFQKKITPNFKGYKVNKALFNPLNGSDKDNRALAEVFHKESDTQIEQACKTRYTNFIGYTSNSKFEQAYKEFMPHVTEVREHAQKVEQDIAKLTELSAKGDSNFSKQQDRIAKSFFELLKIEQTGRKIPNRNGIFIYGDAPNSDKRNFVEWFKKNVPANFEEITYDDSEPLESIKRIVAKAEKAEIVHQQTGKRTVLYIKEMDRLLTDVRNKENLIITARFKNFAEHCSERYHTTILLTTTYPLGEFESATIASHRFETQINLKDGIKPKQKLELKTLQKEKERLKESSSKLSDYFWYEEDDTSSSNNDDRPLWGPYESDEWQYRM